MACGQQKVKGGHGSITASSSASCSASCSASIITLNLGVGCAPSCWPIFGFRNLLGARRWWSAEVRRIHGGWWFKTACYEYHFHWPNGEIRLIQKKVKGRRVWGRQLVGDRKRYPARLSEFTSALEYLPS